MTEQDLRELIRGGESSTVEFKEESVNADNLAAELVAFANFEGGRVLIGIGDDGQVTGCARLDLETFVINVCRNNVRPALVPKLQRVELAGRWVWVVEVPRGETVYATQRGQHFIRVGSTRQVPTQQELLRLFQRKNVLQLDETPVLRAGIAELDVPALQEYVDRLGQSPLDPAEPAAWARDLMSLGVAVAVDAALRPTLAGWLVFGREPQRLFPSYQIRCGAYDGHDLAAPAIREKDLNGRLPDMIEDAVAFLKLTMPQTTRLVNGTRREESYAYPVEAIREAVVNAVCHRDYGVAGSAIRVFLFADRLEVWSPGGLPNTLTIDSLGYRQFARNQTLASLLAGWGYMERRGRGILSMRRACERIGATVSFALSPDAGDFLVSFRPPAVPDLVDHARA